MPTDNARRDISTWRGLDTVLATIRDVGSQPEWIPDDPGGRGGRGGRSGLPTDGALRCATAVGTDRYTLAYEHAPEG